MTRAHSQRAGVPMADVLAAAVASRPMATAVVASEGPWAAHQRRQRGCRRQPRMPTCWQGQEAPLQPLTSHQQASRRQIHTCCQQACQPQIHTCRQQSCRRRIHTCCQQARWQLIHTYHHRSAWRRARRCHHRTRRWPHTLRHTLRQHAPFRYRTCHRQAAPGSSHRGLSRCLMRVWALVRRQPCNLRSWLAGASHLSSWLAAACHPSSRLATVSHPSSWPRLVAASRLSSPSRASFQCRGQALRLLSRPGSHQGGRAAPAGLPAASRGQRRRPC
mmetsp:Transcript_2094/g.5513  ORF Transcript_2094/g.5513 Transcript_2094/m.5513 type:complete len:275 (-) Transcript_2094:1474-2298(-)